MVKRSRLLLGSRIHMVLIPAIVFSLVLLSIGTVGAFERKVLFEDFTSTTCPPCARAAPAVEEALEDVGDDGVAPIAIHVWWPAPGNDPWWLDNQGDNRERVNYYGIRGVPTYMVDGTQYNGARTPDAFANAIRQAGRDESPLSMRLSGSIRDGELEVSLTVEAEDDVRNATLYIALNEDYVEYNGPAGQRDHYDAMVKMIPSARGTDFEIDEGDELELELEQDMDGLGWHELEIDNLILVAWVQGQNGRVVQAQNYSLAIDAPNITVTDAWARDNRQGNNDGRVEPGELGELIIEMRNEPDYLDAEDIVVTLSTESDIVDITRESYELDLLEAGDDTDNRDEPFLFEVDEDAQPQFVEFTVNITAQPEDFEAEFPITIPVGWPPLLVVDDAANERATEAMMGLFGAEELPLVEYYNRTEQGEVDIDLIENFDAVLWHTFNNREDLLSDAEQEALTEYLDNGGKLVLSSIFMVLDYHETELFQDYLHVTLDEEDVRGSLILGMEGEHEFNDAEVRTIGGDGAGRPDEDPSITPLGNAQALMYHEYRDENVGIAAAAYEDDNYRTLVFSFPLESIGGAARSESRYEFLLRVWTWIQRDGGGGEDPELTHFTDFVRTDTNHSLLIQELTFEDEAVPTGWEIGVFTPNEILAGGAVWIEGERMGLAAWGDDEQTEDVVEGFTAGERLNFRAWDNDADEEYSAAAEVLEGPEVWQANAVTVLNLAATGMREIDIPLTEGWNLISVNITPPPEMYIEGNDDGPSPLLMTDQLRVDEDNHQLVIMKDEAGRFYLPAWDFNNIPFWNLAEGYWLKLQEDAELTYTGDPIAPDADVPIEQGWNLIAYYPDYQLDASAPDFHVLSPIIEQVVIAKDVAGRFMIPEFEFSNMTPWFEGQGYQIKVSEDVVLNYPAAEEELAGRSVREYERNRTPGHRASNRNMSLLLNLPDGLARSGDRIAAFNAAGSQVGAATIDGAESRVGMAIWGDDPTTAAVEGLKEGEAFSLKHWDASRGVELLMHSLQVWDGSGLIYENDAYSVLAIRESEPLPVSPYIANVHPNPFNAVVHLDYGLPETARVSVAVYDLAGKLVASPVDEQQTAGRHTAAWNGREASSGIYLIRLQAGDFTALRKVTLVK